MGWGGRREGGRGRKRGEEGEGILPINEFCLAGKTCSICKTNSHRELSDRNLLVVTILPDELRMNLSLPV
jgi:hypothetical protein